MDERPHGALELPARSVAHQKRAEAGPAIGRDRRQPSDAPEVRPGTAALQPKRYSRQEDPVEKALQDRRIAIVPDRVDDDEALGGEQPVDIALNRLRAEREVVIVEPFLARHDRVEVLRVKVAIVDIVARGSE